jgi:hypothetical protein
MPYNDLDPSDNLGAARGCLYGLLITLATVLIGIGIYYGITVQL